MGKEKKVKFECVGGGVQRSQNPTWSRNLKKITFIAATPGLEDVHLQVWSGARSGQIHRDNKEVNKLCSGHVQLRCSLHIKSDGINKGSGIQIDG